MITFHSSVYPLVPSSIHSFILPSIYLLILLHPCIQVGYTVLSKHLDVFIAPIYFVRDFCLVSNEDALRPMLCCLFVSRQSINSMIKGFLTLSLLLLLQLLIQFHYFIIFLELVFNVTFQSSSYFVCNTQRAQPRAFNYAHTLFYTPKHKPIQNT